MGAACACSKCDKAAKAPDPHPEQELLKFKSFITDSVKHNSADHDKHQSVLGEFFVKLGGRDDGMIERGEMVSHLTTLGYKGDGNLCFDLFDLDNSDIISKEEFLACTKADFLEAGPLRMMRKFMEKQFPADHYDESLEQAFKTMDYHEGKHQDKITKNDFITMLNDLKYGGDANIAYNVLDVGGKHELKFGEFKKRLHGLTKHGH